MSAILKSKQTSCSQDNPGLFIFGLPEKGRSVTHQGGRGEGAGAWQVQHCGHQCLAPVSSKGGYAMLRTPGVPVLACSPLTPPVTEDLGRRLINLNEEKPTSRYLFRWVKNWALPSLPRECDNKQPRWRQCPWRCHKIRVPYYIAVTAAISKDHLRSSLLQNYGAN